MSLPLLQQSFSAQEVPRSPRRPSGRHASVGATTASVHPSSGVKRTKFSSAVEQCRPRRSPFYGAAVSGGGRMGRRSRDIRWFSPIFQLFRGDGGVAGVAKIVLAADMTGVGGNTSWRGSERRVAGLLLITTMLRGKALSPRCRRRRRRCLCRPVCAARHLFVPHSFVSVIYTRCYNPIGGPLGQRASLHTHLSVEAVIWPPVPPSY